jgi:hypothetical protein
LVLVLGLVGIAFLSFSFGSGVTQLFLEMKMLFGFVFLVMFWISFWYGFGSVSGFSPSSWFGGGFGIDITWVWFSVSVSFSFSMFFGFGSRFRIVRSPYIGFVSVSFLFVVSVLELVSFWFVSFLFVVSGLGLVLSFVPS